MNDTPAAAASSATTPPPRDSWERLSVPLLAKKLIIWSLFFLALYLARDFFFVAFMTFLISYHTLAFVSAGMRRFSPDRDRPILRRLFTVVFFVLMPMALIGVGTVVVPQLVAQAQHLAGWLSRVNPESEVSRFVETFVGPTEFKAQYGGPGDPRYQKGFAEFKTSGDTHVASYYDFPKVETWVEAGFARQFAEAERGRLRAKLIKEGTSSKDFEDWFVTEKAPELEKIAQSLALKLPPEGKAETDDAPATPFAGLIRYAATDSAEQLLAKARQNGPAMVALEQEWIVDSIERDIAHVQESPGYRKEFHVFYDEQRAEFPDAIPYTFEQYKTLQAARREGKQAFGKALEKISPSKTQEDEAQQIADFEASKQHELFAEWWGKSAVAKLIRGQVESAVSGDRIARLERWASGLLNIPLDLVTAFLLSFFICIDFPSLHRATRRLRETWLVDVYDEIAPALSTFGQLVARAMFAQGIIALCNACMMFVALTFLGVEHRVLLSGAVFVLCLVPTLGMIIAWGLIAAMAFVQPGGGIALVIKCSVAVLGVVMLETFVFSPRILGKMMEVHPVLIIALLPLGQYFFGIWGLILATPVAVYVIHELILQKGLPGKATLSAPAGDLVKGP